MLARNGRSEWRRSTVTGCLSFPCRAWLKQGDSLSQSSHSLDKAAQQGSPPIGSRGEKQGPDASCQLGCSAGWRWQDAWCGFRSSPCFSAGAVQGAHRGRKPAGVPTDNPGLEQGGAWTEVLSPDPQRKLTSALVLLVLVFQARHESSSRGLAGPLA